MAGRDGRPITGDALRDVVICERRVFHDAGTPEVMADQIPTALGRLWSGASARMGELAAVLLAGGAVDLRTVPDIDREDATRAAMVGGAAHVLGGELAHADMVARPDVLSRVEGRWHAGVVGAAPLLRPDGEPEAGHAVEVALAVHLLGVTGLGAGDRGFLLGHDGERIWLAMSEAVASAATSPDRLLQQALDRARGIVAGTASASPAQGPACGMCRWRSLCRSELAAADDLTLLHGVDRNTRLLLRSVATTVSGLAALEAGALVTAGGRSTLPGLPATTRARPRPGCSTS